MVSTVMWIFKKHLPRMISKPTIFVDLWKAEAETDAKRQNSRVGFHPLPNAEILDLRGFGGQDWCRFCYQTLPKYIPKCQIQNPLIAQW